MITKEFILAGKAIFTIDVPVSYQEQEGMKSHYTYKVNFKKGDGYYADAYFINLLTGPDNTNDYTYLGMLVNDGIRLTNKSPWDMKSWPVMLLRRSIQHIWNGTTDKIIQAGFDIHHVGRCGRCGKPLTTHESIMSRIGPICAKKA